MSGLLRLRRGSMLLAVVFLNLASAPAQEPTSRTVASVDGEAISAADVDRELAIAFGDRSFEPAAREALRRETVEQLIRRLLVLRYLRESDQVATDADVELAVERLRKSLAQRENSWEAFLREKKLDEVALRKSLLWQLSWQRQLEKFQTDANLKNYFDKHRRDFDGTEIRVAQIFFAADKTATEKTLSKHASEVLAEIREGKTTFEEAARKYSSAPSRNVGGDLGWIRRREPMPEAFSRAAFALDVGEISEPVKSAQGVHLIRCVEIRPGQRTWEDARPELRAAVSEYLFGWMAEQHRPKAKIERF